MSGFLTHTSPLKADIFQCRALTSGPSFDHTKAPQNSARRSRRLCHTPLCGKKSGFSCFLPPLRPLAFLGLWGCGYILAEQRPGVRETPAALHWPGSVVSAFFCAQLPKQCRCHMFRFFLSSRFLRFRYRLQFLAERSASVLVLAAVFFMAFVGVTA